LENTINIRIKSAEILYFPMQSVNVYKLYKSSKFESIDTSVNTIDNFFNILQEVLEDDYNETTINFTKRFTLWTKQKRYPVLQVTRSSEKKVMISLLQNYPNESYPKNLWIYVTYITKEYPHVIKKGWLAPHKPILHLDLVERSHWIVVNMYQTGKCNK